MIKIVSERTPYHRFALYFDPRGDIIDFCRVLKESFGFTQFSYRQEGEKKFWVFSQAILVRTLQQQFPEVIVEPAVEALVVHELGWRSAEQGRLKRIDALREKKTTTFQVKGLKGKLYPYQLIGVEFLIESGGRAIISDSMGLGKTAQALAFVKHSGFKRTLVVCPASVKFAWNMEVRKWTNLTSVVIDSRTNLSQIHPDVQVWIVNYDILRKHHGELVKTKFDCMVGDECTFIKSSQAARTRSFRSISREVGSVVLLSGTPLLSRPAELFSLLNIIDSKTWYNWYDYARTYCAMRKTKWGMDFSGASNIEELHARIKRYFIRREKTQVLTELPPKTFIDIPVQLDNDIAKKYDKAAGNLAVYLRDHAGKQPAEIIKTMAAAKLTQLNVLRQLGAVGKVGVAIELIESILSAGEKVVVFSSFVQPLETIQSHFAEKAVLLTGHTDVKDRQLIVEKFQNDKHVQVFCGGYKSAGIGITLTAATNFIGLDRPWNPADLQQSIDRIHRIGQRATNVNIYQLVATGTIDDDMKDILDDKQDIFDKVIDGKFGEKIANGAMTAAINRILQNH